MTNSFDQAARTLVSGHLVAFPTETVYGLGADATNPDAVAKIYAAKGRPADHPLIVHVSSFEKALPWVAELPTFAEKLAAEFWPGPMTLILKRSLLAGNFVTGNQETVGIRVPSHESALTLLSTFENLGGLGVAAPSANRFGKVSPTTFEAVQAELGQYLSPQDMILQGGNSSVGIESTIIDCTSERPSILRLGAVTGSQIEAVTNLKLGNDAGDIRVSGSLKSHYAPDATLVLNTLPIRGDGLIAPASFETPEGVVRLSAPRSTEEYARELYSALRLADQLGLKRIVAITPESEELANAVIDRLTRASYKL